MQGDETLYAAASKLPGFAEDSKVPTSKRTPQSIFKTLCWKWEKRMASIVTAALGSADGFIVRNVLLYLRKVVGVRVARSSCR